MTFSDKDTSKQGRSHRSGFQVSTWPLFLTKKQRNTQWLVNNYVVSPSLHAVSLADLANSKAHDDQAGKSSLLPDLPWGYYRKKFEVIIIILVHLAKRIRRTMYQPSHAWIIFWFFNILDLKQVAMTCHHAATQLFNLATQVAICGSGPAKE